MIAQKSVIDELEEAIASKEIGRRADTLRRITDLFISGSLTFSEDQIALFDEVMGLITESFETVTMSEHARVLLGNGRLKRMSLS